MLKFVLSSITLLFILNSCQQVASQDEKNNKVTDKLEAKQEPHDHEIYRLFGPEPTEKNVKAYNNAMLKARSMSRSDFFGGEWTIQGPGNLGGCVNVLATQGDDADIIYAGFSRGGLWKSTDGGTNWASLWDDMTAQAISAIVIDPTDSQTIYVGTGDVNVSGTPYVGDGVWKSTDGGNSWSNIGLGQAYIVGDIVLDPTNTQNITVATMGIPFVENADRGIYHSSDGGANWTQTLLIDEQTGVADLAVHPENPNIMLAGGWTRIRNGKVSFVSGVGSGTFRSIDGGLSWNKMELAVPDSMGRTAVCFSENTPGLAYAMYITPDNFYHSLHKSVDDGATWQMIDTKIQDITPRMMGGFAWYFGRIESLVDPADNVEKLYLCGVDLWSFNEQQNLWNMMTPIWWLYDVHADKHSIIKDADGNILIGTDGGVYRFDGLEWSDIENIPTNMFYRVAYNPFDASQYYGGMQDNGTAGGNVEILDEWGRLFGGDGFQMIFDPEDQSKSYVETQRGNIYYSDDFGYNYFFMDKFPVSDDRTNWDMQYIQSPHNPNVLYTGTYRAIQITRDQGFHAWEPISDQLTDDVEFTTSYHTITALDESILEEGLLYYGTADGNVWKQDNGQFVNISAGLPEFYISSIKASPSNEDHVFVTLSSYLFGDDTPRIYKSIDRGASWESLGTGLPEGAVNDILVYKEYNDSLLFAATNIGVYATVDAGEIWHRLGDNMPLVPVRDMVVNEEQNQLVAGTYGRSIQTYPIDSLEKEFIVEVVATKELADSFFAVGPNPTTDYVTIKVGKELQVNVYSQDGKEMYSQLLTQEKSIDLSQWQAGIYVIVFRDVDTGKQASKPLVVL